MEKLGVEEDDGLKKEAEKSEETRCPKCGAVVEKHGSVLKCPKCGTEPFEKGDD